MKKAVVRERTGFGVRQPGLKLDFYHPSTALPVISAEGIHTKGWERGMVHGKLSTNATYYSQAHFSNFFWLAETRFCPAVTLSCEHMPWVNDPTAQCLSPCGLLWENTWDWRLRNNIYFSWSGGWRVQDHDAGQLVWWLMRAHFLVHRAHLLVVSSHGGRGEAALWSLFHKGSKSHSWGLLSLWPRPLPKAPTS